MLMDNLTAAGDPSTLVSSRNYQLYRCPPSFDETVDDGSFVDLAGGDGSTMLAPGPFTWLLNICRGHHLFRREMECWVEPYTPSRFTRQFGYDQLYIGNPNPG